MSHYKQYSAHERQIVLSGKSNKIIARLLKRTPQAIDNAKRRFAAFNKPQSPSVRSKRVTTTSLDITGARSIKVSKTGINIEF